MKKLALRPLLFRFLVYETNRINYLTFSPRL